MKPLVLESIETHRPVLIYRDCFNCEICGTVVCYIGLEELHSKFCQSCQDEISKGQGMSNKFRKMYQQFSNVKVKHIADD